MGEVESLLHTSCIRLRKILYANVFFQDKYIAPLVVQMLQMMTDLRDEEEWAMEDEVDEVDSDVSSIVSFP